MASVARLDFTVCVTLLPCDFSKECCKECDTKELTESKVFSVSDNNVGQYYAKVAPILCFPYICSPTAASRYNQ